MQYDSVIETTLSQVQNLVIKNPGAIADPEVVSRVRGYISRPSVQDAMQRANDTLMLFALRTLNYLLADRSVSPHQTVNRLRDVMDDPELNRALNGREIS